MTGLPAERVSALRLAVRAIKEVNAVATIAAGVSLSALGIGSFLLPAHFIDGGCTGLSMLLAHLVDQKLLPLFLVVINAPFVALGYRHIGRRFAWRGGAAILAHAAVLAVVPFPVATTDKLLAATFGGFFIGAGVGLAIRGGGVLDGTEILAVLLSKRFPATVGEVVLGLNVLIFATAAFVFGIEPALYSGLTYFAGMKTIDFLLHGLEAYNAVLVMSPRNHEVRLAILAEMGRGVTILSAKGGYSRAEQEVLLCVVTRLEITRFEAIVRGHDPTAFLVILPVLEAIGGVVKQRKYH